MEQAAVLTGSSKRRNKFTSYLYLIFLFIIVAYGVYVRLGEYLTNRSFWLDEASLALNVINKSFLQLITQPLDYNQAAPIGFLLLAKLSAVIFGNNEYALRVVPFISGIAVLFLFYKLSAKCAARGSALLALALFSVSSGLLRYATEFKQYSSDVLFALIIGLAGISVLAKEVTAAPLQAREFNFKKGVSLGITGAASIWFSHPAVFMLAGIGTTLSFVYLSKRRLKEMRNLCVTFVFWAMSFALLYLMSLRVTAGNPAMQDYWKAYFLPLPPYSSGGQFLFLDSFIGIFYVPGIRQSLFGAAAFVLGGCAIFKKNKYLLIMLLIPLIFTLAVSSLHLYPLAGRLLLFYLPFAYLFVAEGLFYLIGKHSYFLRAVGLALSVIILWPSLSTAYSQLSSKTFYYEDIKPVLRYVQTHIGREDAIYVYHGAERVFRYYMGFYGLDKNTPLQGISSEGDWGKYRTDLLRLKDKKRGWIIFAQVYNVAGESEEDFMTDYLDSIGTGLDAVKAHGTSAYLYRFNE